MYGECFSGPVFCSGGTAKPSKKGTGFAQPLGPHEHWHIDVSYINLSGTFYYLCSILDGYSRSIVHWDIGESMTEAEVEMILERAKEKFPGVKPRVISDNGPQFIARDFKEFIRISGMTHVKTSPFYPQSNGKIERWHQSLKRECIRPGVPLTLEDARRLVAGYMDYYNQVRLHSALGYVTPQDKLEGKEKEIFAERDRKTGGGPGLASAATPRGPSKSGDGLHACTVGGKLIRLFCPIAKVIHRGVESGEILADPEKRVGGPKGKILELS